MQQNNSGLNWRYVFGDGKAIKSETHRKTTWFYRNEESEIIATSEAHLGYHTVPIDTLERNLSHRDTDVSTVPVEDTPISKYL